MILKFDKRDAICNPKCIPTNSKHGYAPTKSLVKALEIMNNPKIDDTCLHNQKFIIYQTEISQGLKLSLQFSCRQHNSMVSGGPTPISQRHVCTDASRNGCDIHSIREGEPEVWFARWQIHSLPSLRELLLGIGVGHRRRNNYSFTLLPVGWCSNAMSGCQLKRIQNTNNLVEVTTSCAWVKEAQFQLPKKASKSRVSFKLPIIAYS